MKVNHATRLGWAGHSLFWAVLLAYITQVAAINDDYAWWQYATIPPISGIVGYLTNVLALKMTFYPIEFLGIPIVLIKNQPFGLFGWQGIVPAKAEKMARISVDLMMGKLIDPVEVFDRLDPEHVVKLVRPEVEKILKRVVDDSAEREMPAVWKTIPEYLKQDFYQKSVDDIPNMIKGILNDFRMDLYNYIDVADMLSRRFMLDKALLCDCFITCGKKELKFIERSGFYFGFLFGVVQMILWFFYDEKWVLPVAGFFVGFATNLIALKMIFEPIEPIPIFGGRFHIQGLFLKRQKEVAEQFGHLAAQRVLTAERLWDDILYGPRSKEFQNLERKHMELSLQRILSNADPAMRLYLGDKELQRVKDRIGDITAVELPKAMKTIYSYSDEAMEMEKDFRVKMAALSSPEFEGVLHPIFQEDEIKLILVGGFLGTMVGLFQAFVVF